LTLLRVPVADDLDFDSDEKIFDVVLLMDSLYSWYEVYVFLSPVEDWDVLLFVAESLSVEAS
jgi:hypothetical protein